MKKFGRTLTAAWTAASLIPGCAWVDLKPAGEKVRILSAQEVGRCKELGRVSAATAAKIGFIARGRGTVQEEVDRLARNHAGEMGGDAIVPSAPLIEGEQPFKVYRCIFP